MLAKSNSVDAITDFDRCTRPASLNLETMCVSFVKKMNISVNVYMCTQTAYTGCANKKQSLRKNSLSQLL